MTAASRLRRFVIGLLAATCVMGVVARAQDAFDMHSADMIILQSKGIQKAIGLSEAQRSRMNSFAATYKSQLTAYQNELQKSKKQPDGARLRNYELNLRSHVFAQLTPGQLRRLREISLQHDGLAALGDDVVAKRVGLNSAQIEKVRSIIVADRKQMAAYQQAAAGPIIAKYQKFKPKSQAEGKALGAKFTQEMRQAAARYAPKIKATVASDRARIMSLLSAKQRATWTALLGKPFNG